MTKIIFGMTISLDGYINDREGSVSRLYPDLSALGETDLMQDAIRHVGAVVMGRHTYDMANGDFTGYEFQTPIFVVTHYPPAVTAKGENENLTFTFVTDGVASAIALAQAAAGDKDVTVVGGADLGQQLLNAGLLDELQIGIVPQLLGGGQRLFEKLDTDKLKLEQIKIIETPQRTDIYYRVPSKNREHKIKGAIPMAAKTPSAAKQPKSDFPKTSAPAQRALQGAGIYTLKQLSKKTEAQVAALHGMGPRALGILRAAMAEKGLAFAKPTKLKP